MTGSRDDAELSRSEELNRRIIENVPGGIVQVGMDGSILRANLVAQQFLGLSYDELHKRFISDFGNETILEDGSPCPVADYPVARCLVTGEPQPAKLIGVRRPDGRVFWGLFTAVPIKPPGQSMQGVVVTFLDITERKRAEENIRNIAEGVSAATGQEFFRLLVSYLARTLGADFAMVGELVGEKRDVVRSRAVFQDGQIRDEVSYALPDTPCDDVIRGNPCEHPAGVQRLFPRDDMLGELGIQAYFGTPLADSSGVVRGLVVVMFRNPVDDVKRVMSTLRIFASRAAAELERLVMETERRKLEAQVQHAQRMESLGVMAGGIAHDFNNLLMTILGHAGLAEAEVPPGVARESLRQIETAAQRASELVQQLLVYSGRSRLHMEPVDFRALVKEMAGLLQVSISRGAVLKTAFDDGTPLVMADATQLRQVVMNLIINASDALGERQGTITVRTTPCQVDAALLRGMILAQPDATGLHACLEVVDTGCGMDAETLSRIFEPFYTTKFTGRGLGLSAVLGIVRSHHGAIGVDSQQGVGTTFRILLPAAPELGAPQRPSPMEAPRGLGRVLVVDDEPGVRNVLRAMLERKGFQVVTAADGREAVEIFAQEEGRFTAVLLDMTMPRMGGREALRLMRATRVDVPVLLASGYHDQAETTTLEHGMVEFIKKPFQSKDLVMRLQALIDRAARRPG
ncbi:MAG: response regulator [Myxococcota bacterium]